MGPAPSKIQDVEDLKCPPNSYFTKIQTRAGDMVDKIELWCKDGTYKSKGGNGGDLKDAFVCEQGFDEMKLRVGNAIDNLQVRCSNGTWSNKWGGNGGSEYHIKACSDAQKVVTGLNSIGTYENKIATNTEITRIVDCGDRVNCLDDANVFNQECTKRTDGSYNDKVREFCNRNDENAMSSGCINWCKNNSTSCTRYNDLTDCKTFGITVPDCTRAKIDETQTLCKKYKIIQSDIGNTGVYPCNVNSIKELEKECKEYDVSLNSCSPDSLENAKDTALTVAIQQEAEKKAAERYNATQQMINQTLGISGPATKPTKTTPPPISEDYTMYIIIAIILLVLFMSSSSISVFILMNKEE
jgi:hypothetical protein